MLTRASRAASGQVGVAGAVDVDDQPPGRAVERDVAGAIRADLERVRRDPLGVDVARAGRVDAFQARHGGFDDVLVPSSSFVGSLMSRCDEQCLPVVGSWCRSPAVSGEPVRLSMFHLHRNLSHLTRRSCHSHNMISLIRVE